MISTILLIIAPILMIVGVSRFTGLGWAIFIFDFITHRSVGGHLELQKAAPPARTTIGKLIGLFCLLTSVMCFILAFS
jgi:hypothetical protein